MDKNLLDKYPLATKAFAEHDAFYKRHSIDMPPEIKKSRERAAELIDSFAGGTDEFKDALMVVALISVDPLPCHKMYGNPAYGKDVEKLMATLIEVAKVPGTPLPPELAPVITLISVVKMEEAMDEISAGKLEVTPAALKGSMHRAALNDQIYLPNLDNKKLQDLYETTQFAYFCTIERAALREKKPPPPAHPGGPVF